MGSRTLLIASSIIGLLTPGSVSAQADARTEFDPAAGVYRIFYEDGTGRENALEVTPATLVAPDVRSTFSLDDGGMVRYRYRVANGVGARQPIQSLSIVGGIGAIMDAAPHGWRGESVPSRNRSYWYKVVSADAVGGINIGEALNFSVSSTALPGPSTAELRGDAPVVSIPSGLPESAMRALEQLSARDFVTVPVIVPMIPSGHDEPELTRDVFVARLEQMFARALARSHPRGRTILAGLAEARRLYSESATPADGDVALRAVLADVQHPTAKAWVGELGRALAMGIEHVLASKMARRSP